VRLSVADPALFATLRSTLESRAVVIMPCDTIYGMVGIAPETEASLRRVKGRGEKSFLLLVPSVQWLPRFTEQELPDALRRYWPGALTVIFRGKGAPGETVALRVPDDPLLLGLMESLQRPLFSTSVNRSGEPSLWRIADILDQFGKRVDLVVDAGDRSGGLPSTILDVTAAPFRILRHGAVDLPPDLLR
jgi:L-threonylcarbamoyladenylate synthase